MSAVATAAAKHVDVAVSSSKILAVQVDKALAELFTSSIKKAFPAVEMPEILLSLGKFADYQCNNAMALAKALGQLGTKMSPKDVGEAMIKNLPENDLIDKAVTTPQGFINVDIHAQWTADAVKRVLSEGIKPPSMKKQKVLVDFSSPNIAKEMHVGHLRSTIIGESICRVFEFVGFDVQRINHVGDWGTQFGMLIQHLKDKHPDFLEVPPPISDLVVFYKEAKKRFDEDNDFKDAARKEVVKLQSYQPESIKAWEAICDLSRKEFQQIYSRLDIKLEERGESFYNKMIPGIVQQLDDKKMTEMSDGAKIIISAEKKSATSLDAKDFSKLMTHFVQPKRGGEPEWHPVLLKVMVEHKVLDESDGKVQISKKEKKLLAKVDLQKDIDKIAEALAPAWKGGLHPEIKAHLESIKLIDGDYVKVPRFPFPLMVVKSDGGFTYDTTDLACIYHRFQVDKVDRVVYVTDVGQYDHFRQVAQVADDIGWIGKHQRWDHAGFGLVLGEDGTKLKTRSGETIKLRTLLDEGCDRALKIIQEREASEQKQGHSEEEMIRLSKIIGYGAVKYFDLKQTRKSDYAFSFDKMLEFTGNTAVCLLYAYARLASILRKADAPPKEKLLELTEKVQVGDTGAEKRLILAALRFPSVIEKTLEDLQLKNITDFVYGLVNALSEFYRDCRVIGHEFINSRLLMIHLVMETLKQGLALLGIEAPDRL